jgi:conjugative relaxase-like TrwC/TraI family protein
VLRVWKLRAGGGAYYLEAALGTPSARPIEEPGRWIGSAAAVEGLTGTVDRERFEMLLAGRSPATGEELGRARRQVTVVGFDCTFSAPKSVSLLHALGDPDVAGAVAAGHDRAVSVAVGYLEDRALAVRRRVGDLTRVPVPTTGAVGGAFGHRVSRALDPHLHTHVVLANAGEDGSGRWSALDGRGIFAHAGAADALYHAQLRHELSASLGVAWEPLRRGRADVAGIGAEARRAFSRRAAAIEEELHGWSAPSHRTRQVAAHVTRQARTLEVGADDLRPQWQERARLAGLSPARLDAVLDRVARRRGPDGTGVELVGAPALADDERVASLLAERVAGRAVAGREADFSRRDVVQVVAASTPLGAGHRAVSTRVEHFVDSLDLPSAERSRPGVAEARLVLPEELRRRALSQLLERRGMAPLERSAGRDGGIERALG